MKLSLQQRLEVATRLYATVDRYFAHWVGVPDLDFDAEYRAFLATAVEAEDRRHFLLEAMRLLSKLRNGHTDLYDSGLWNAHNQSFGFYATRIATEWIVTRSTRPEIHVGDQVLSIDGMPIENFYQTKRPYLCLSTERAAVARLFMRRYLFPDQFEVTLSAAGTLRCAKDSGALGQSSISLAPSLEDAGGIPVVKIPSFEDGQYEEKAVEYVRSLADRQTIIIDLRGNGGGSTPMQLVECLMDRPYRMWTQISALVVSADDAQHSSATPPNVLDRIHRPYIVSPSPLITPVDDAFKGGLIVLIDEYCNSAAEDFLLPLTQNDRATLIGEATAGSSGQPYITHLDGEMRLRVGAKRQLFPDGREFEGVGFIPKIQHTKTPDEVRSGRDAALALAVEVAWSANPSRSAVQG